MPTEQISHIPFTRAGIDYILHMGTDAEGDSVDYIDRVQPDDKGNLLRYYPAETHIYRDMVKKRGGMSAIKTVYYCGVRGADDEIIPGSDTPNDCKIKFDTGKLDILYFIAGLGRPIMMSGNNGLIRNAPFGFNTMPIFYTQNVKDASGNIIHYAGEVVAYTPEQEAEPPTNDYWLQTNPQIFAQNPA